MITRPDDHLLREVQEAIGLPSAALVEKDWHVVQALAAMATVNLEGMSLVFGGGTSLSRAHKLIERMSEDIDLRIIGAEGQGRNALKRFRRAVSASLEAAGFKMDAANPQVSHADEYVRWDIPYDPIIAGQGVLRPEIKIELAAFPTRRDPVVLPVRSFVAEALQQDPEVPAMACVSIVDTAADKLVGLARRAGEAYARDGDLDHTLVRHVYDLHRLNGAYDPVDATALASLIMQDEAARGYEAYAKDPRGASLATLQRMSQDEAVIAGYERLLEAMVYGARPSFNEAWASVQALADRL